MKIKVLVFFMLIFTALCVLFFNAFYIEAKKTAISKLYDEQSIHAKQAAHGIEEYFSTWASILASFAKMDEIIRPDEFGKNHMKFLFEAHQDQIRSITRVNEKGIIICTYPVVSSVGTDISGQKHIREILRNHKPVISDVFRTAQGFDAVALHVPVFSGKEFKGTLAAVVNFENLAKRYLDVIKIGVTGYAWVVSRDGTQLYSPVPGFTGIPASQSYRSSPSALLMIDNMLKGEKGTTAYSLSMSGRRSLDRKYAVYTPIKLYNTFWSIVVVSSEEEVLSGLVSFRNKLAVVVAIIFVCGIVLSALGAKAWVIVTESEKRKKIEKELRQSEELYRNLFESHAAVKITLDTETGNILDANNAAANFYGWSREQLRRMNIKEINTLPPDEIDREIIKARNKERIHFEFKHRLADGSIRDVEVFSSRIVVKGKDILHSIIHDITERKHAEERLMQSEAELRRLSNEFQGLLDAIPDHITLKDRNLKVLWANRAAADGLNKKSEDLIGRYCYAIWHNTDSPCSKCPVLHSFSTARPTEVQSATPDGRIWNLRTVPLFDEERNVVSVIEVARDVTEHLKLEDQLRHAQKMEGIGQLAGGIAHDFNNLLNAVLGYASLIQMHMPESDPMRHYVDQIIAAVMRGASLTRQILALSRKQLLDIKSVDMNEVVRDFEHMLSRLVREDITIQYNLHNASIMIMADPGQIMQVLMNLAANASDAMPDGGTLLVSTELFEMDERYVDMHGFDNPGTYALLSVADTGCGMTEDVRLKIFDPFFTTKEVGKGTGLGLAVVHGIVKQHNGYINVYSELGKGTVFRIYLPITEQKPAESGSAPSEKVSGGTETILVAEDDLAIRALTNTILEQYGYRVISAVDGEDAVRKFEKKKDEINLVILDGIMPKKNGKEAFEEIRKLRPDIKAVFISGYAEDIFTHDGMPDKSAVFIPKPVKPDELLRAVRSTLDS
ncbi:MAG: PAS domain S-box protein [Nitrospiraceae bacterium]|nr:PAS domain S-box protein [Nitrospiraceae bacterium]